MSTWHLYRKRGFTPLSVRAMHSVRWTLAPLSGEKFRLAANDSVHRNAETDSITGAVTTQLLERRIMSVLKGGTSIQGVKHFLLKINIEQIKPTNEMLTGETSDSLLTHLAQTIARNCVHADTIARMGDSSFGILLTSSTLNDTLQIAERLQKALTIPCIPYHFPLLNVECSIGIKEINSLDETISQVLSDTEAACSKARKYRQNKIRVFSATDTLLIRHQDEMQCASQVVDALNFSKIELFAQAITPLCAEAESGDRYEILIRMKDHSGALHAPGDFLKAAERYNLMRDIDRYVISSSFHWLKRAYGGCSNRRLLSASINLSGDSLSDPFLVSFIRQELKKNPVLPSTISFEITEDRAIEDMTLAVNLVKELKSLGFHLSLDDFGTGLASFSYLKAFPFDYLKIDGSFIQELNSDQVNQAIVNSINAIAHQMGMKTVAEYVESESVAHTLRNIGVDYIQGHLVGKPMPLQAFQRMHESPEHDVSKVTVGNYSHRMKGFPLFQLCAV